MSPEKQRIAIATACGWLDISRCSRKLNPHPDGATYRGTLDPPSINYGREYRELPDYLNDLNAMHEVEKILTRDQRQQYVNLLWPTGYAVQDAIMASALQRAEAFLKTLGLWTED